MPFAALGTDIEITLSLETAGATSGTKLFDLHKLIFTFRADISWVSVDMYRNSVAVVCSSNV